VFFLGHAQTETPEWVICFVKHLGMIEIIVHYSSDWYNLQEDSSINSYNQVVILKEWCKEYNLFDRLHFSSVYFIIDCPSSAKVLL
jgi:hypothetical protein